MKKNSIKTMIFGAALFTLVGCSTSSEQELAPHRPDVYVNGFPVISIDVDFDLPINWDTSDAGNLQFFRDNWLGATLNISNTSPEFELEDVDIRARGRGNSTWWSFGAKRPVRFRFPDENQPIFDSPHAGRDWVTFANASDDSHLRNFIAYYLGEMLHFNFVPQLWFAHMYIDGDYRGVYLVLDERESGPGRGDLYLHEDPTISEFMIEFDVRTGRYADEPVNTHWVDVRGSWDIRYPSTSAWMSAENNPHALYVDDFITRLDRALIQGDEETVRAMIDVDSFVDYYILQEFTKNQDARWSSLFFQIRGQGDERRMYAGPIWDFDLSAGNTADTESPIGSHATRRDSGHYLFDWWFFLNDMPWFHELASERWHEIRDVEIRQALDRANYMAINFADEFERDFERWPNQRTRYLRDNWNSSATTRSLRGFAAHTEFLFEWYEERILWLDEWFGN